jgi:hypothetical protein
VAVHPTIRKAILEHLDKGAFELRVATNFDAIKATPAHDSLKAALAQVEQARVWVRECLDVDGPKPAQQLPPVGEGLPLTRKERLGYRWP